MDTYIYICICICPSVRLPVCLSVCLYIYKYLLKPRGLGHDSINWSNSDGASLNSSGASVKL